MAQLPFKNIDLFNPSLAGKIDYAFDTPYAFQDVLETETKKAVEKKPALSATDDIRIGGLSLDDYNALAPETQTNVMLYELVKDNRQARKEAQEEKKYYRSDEYLDKMYERADDINARQMARAQKYGKESAMYGFLDQGLPNLMAQAAFSRYAFAPDAVKGVQDAYRRINLAQAVKPQGGQSYMSVNPMG